MKILFTALALVFLAAFPVKAASDAWLLATYTCSTYAGDYGLGADNCITADDVAYGQTVDEAKIEIMRELIRGDGGDDGDDD